MAKKHIPFEEEYKQFLIQNNISEDSAKSYCDYVRGSIKNVKQGFDFQMNGKVWNFSILFDNFDHLVVRNIVTRQIVLDIIKFLISSEYSCTKSYEDNIKTALRIYLVFLYEKIEEIPDKKHPAKNRKIENVPFFPINSGNAKLILKQIPQLKEGKTEYRKEVLRIIFASRFITQERKGGTYAVELHLREISKELNIHKMESLRKWALTFLESNIKFLVKDQTYIPFNKINNLKIDEKGDVIISSGRQSWVVLSKYANGNAPTSFANMAKEHKRTTEMKLLALDHDTPIYQVLKQMENNVPTLKLFNSKLKSPAPRLTQTQCKDLFDEFKKIHEHVSFTIMHQIENIKKGKGK